MKPGFAYVLGAAGVLGLAGFFLVDNPLIAQQPPGGGSDSVNLTFGDSYEIPASDARTDSIVASARAFMAMLTNDQKEAVLFAFTDNAQRGNWSNLPQGIVQRRGVRLGELSTGQRTALDSLLSEILSESGSRNVEWQLAADDTLATGRRGRPNFGSDYFYVSFLGEPSTSNPWMFQFGGHHLAINVTFLGADATFSPMLTGGQPLHITFEGDEVHITERELTAAQTFMDSLSEGQRNDAVRGNRPINLLLGPGEYGTVVAPEGISAADLTDEQKALLLDVIVARLGFINDDDFDAIMSRIEAEFDQAYFGWWGPLNVLGAAYFRVTGPSIVMEYAPQRGFGGGDGTEHAHSMYRNPRNDYGSAWLSVRH
jgi:hypothetical protein